MPFDENSRNARFGAAGEERVEGFMRSRQLFVTRLCNIKNPDGIGAPMLMGAAFNLILPDFQVIDPRKIGQPFYVEVKTKSRAAWYVKGQTFTHGVDAPNWRQYRRVHEVTGLPVWLLVLDDDNGELLGLGVHRTKPDHECEPNDAFPRGGVFWRRSQFVLVAQLERRQGVLDVDN